MAFLPTRKPLCMVNIIMICRAVIVDRSILAINMYRLLLSPMITTFLVFKRYEQARPFFFRRDKPNLAIVNSNTFGKKFDKYYDHFSKDEPLKDIPKIFLCREMEEEWRARLEKLSGSTVVTRPFHPDVFLDLIRCITEERR